MICKCGHTYEQHSYSCCEECGPLICDEQGCGCREYDGPEPTESQTK